MALVSACGGSATTSRTAFIQRVNGMCDQLNRAGSAVPYPMDPADRLPTLRRQVALLTSGLQRFIALTPIPSETQAYSNLLVIVSREVTITARLRNAMIAHDHPSEVTLARQAARLNLPFEARVTELGFPTCAENVPSTHYLTRNARERFGARLNKLCAEPVARYQNTDIDERVSTDQLHAGKMTPAEYRATLLTTATEFGTYTHSAATGLAAIHARGPEQGYLRSLTAQVNRVSGLFSQAASALRLGQPQNVSALMSAAQVAARDAVPYAVRLDADTCAQL